MKKIALNNYGEIDIDKIIRIVQDPGNEIMNIYSGDFQVTEKKSESFDSGHSPLTEADLKSHQIITRSLKENYPKIPILSEEGKDIGFEERKKWEYFWLIDPLDGTKGFIKRDGSFTVNIALIQGDSPILGVVYAPASKIFYYGDNLNGSFKKINGNAAERLPLPKRRDSFIVVASKQHFDKETENFIDNLKKEHPNLELASFGSSLKLCVVAEGEADIYPRLGPTMEWDTAAAHAVVRFAGKKVYDYNTKEDLKYNKENLLNPWFVVE